MTTALHQTWNSLTQQTVNPWASERIWFEFQKAGFTLEDLVMVLKFMVYHNAHVADPKYRYRFNLRRHIGDLEWFASMLASVRAVKRNRVTRTARDVVLEQSGRPRVVRTDTAKPIREVLRAMRDL